MLENWLEWHRATLALKCEGLEDHQLRTAAVEPSSLTLLGLVQHLAEVERMWFQRVFAGEDIPMIFGEEMGYGFVLDAEHGPGEALAVWRAQIERNRELMADASLDDIGELSAEDAEQMGETHVSLRWIMIHMIEEYARHNGHADLLRERIDGRTGA